MHIPLHVTYDVFNTLKMKINQKIEFVPRSKYNPI